MGQFGLIHNGNSRRSLNGDVDASVLERLVKICGGLFRAPENCNDALDTTVREFCSEGIGIVIVNGGDGTFHKVLTSYIINNWHSALPNFVLLKSGTMNLLANNFGITDEPELSLRRFVYSGDIRKVLSLRTLCVKSDQEVYYGMVFAAGAIYNFTFKHGDTNDGEPKSIPKAICMVAKGIASKKYSDTFLGQTNATLSVDGQARGSSFTALLVSSYKLEALGIKPFKWASDVDSGFYEADTNMDRTGWILGLPYFYAGKKVSKANYGLGAKSVVLSSDREVGYTLDGDFFKGKNIIVTQGPEIQIIKV